MSVRSIKTAAETSQADYTVTQLLNTPGAFEKFASEQLPKFIRETRDYQSFARQVLLCHNITGDQVQLINNEPYVYYPKDFDSHATFYADDGEIPRLQIEGEGVNVGIMTISSDDVSIHLKRLLVQKYNYLERVKDLSSQSVVKAEDSKVLDLVERVIQGNGTAAEPEHKEQVVTFADTSLLKSHLIALKKCLSTHDVPLFAFVMNQTKIDDILEWSQNEVDQLTQREILETGAKYTIWGDVKLIPSRIVRENCVYAFAEPEYVGRMPILKDLTVRLTQTENKLEQGLFMFEFIGLYIASQKAVAKCILEYEEDGDLIEYYNEDVMAKGFETPVKGYGSLEGK